jgi:hypothetical protein
VRSLDAGHPQGPRGWLLLLCAFLLVWRPWTFAVELAGVLPSLGLRGPLAVAELVAHGAAAACAVAGGWALWTSSPHRLVLARAGVITSAIVSVQSLYWSVLPSQTRPGDELPLALLAVVHAAIWLVYLSGVRGQSP